MLRLSAILGLSNLTGEFRELSRAGTQSFLSTNNDQGGIPRDASEAQLFLLLTSRWIRSLKALEEFVQWLDAEVTDELRVQFDSMLAWPIVQSSGSFVQGAWAEAHEETVDWAPWLRLFRVIQEYAQRRNSPRFGCEAVRAESIVLSEYCGDVDGALGTVARAAEVFGNSSVLDEQLANVYFQSERYQDALAIWANLVKRNPETPTLDPFAFRRAAISAARLGRLDDAATIFWAGVESIQPGELKTTQFGLAVDCAYVKLQAGHATEAARTLADAVLRLPHEASLEGEARWDAVQRVAVEVCRCNRELSLAARGEV